MMGVELQDQLLELLTHKIRILSVEQVAREVCEGAKQEAKKMMQVLQQMSLLKMQTAVLHPLLSLDEPVLDWTPGDPHPNFPRLGYQLKSRWNQPPQVMLVCRATRKGREQMEGTVGGRRTRATELRHDLHVAELYFKLIRESPHLSWIHEDTLIGQGIHNQAMAIPDAIVDGHVHDFGGSYKSEKLLKLHNSFSSAPYTIW